MENLEARSTPAVGAGSAASDGVARRRALIRLGLAVGAAYVAPMVLSVDRSAQAMGPSCAKNPKNC